MKHPDNRPIPNPTGAINPNEKTQEITPHEARLQMVDDWTSELIGDLPRDLRPLLARWTEGLTAYDVGTVAMLLDEMISATIGRRTEAAENFAR